MFVSAIARVVGKGNATLLAGIDINLATMNDSVGEIMALTLRQGPRW